jgi:D-alanyl-D-alanine carboxypeptidase
LLGRAIQDHFPRYYRYFSTTSFVYHGQTIHGHNHLLGSMAGVDGIKTGFTRASGFNLVTSVHRDNRYIVGVVLGGRSAFERDAHMRELIEANFKLAAARRTAPVVAERAEPSGVAQPVASAREPAPARAEPAATATPRGAVGANEPIRPVAVKTITYRTVTVRTGSLAPMPVLVPVVSPTPPSVAPYEPTQAQSQAPTVEAPRTVVASAETTIAINPEPIKPESAATASANPAPVKPAPATSTPASPPPHAHSGWMIQIGAFEGEDEARQHLSEARLKVHAMLATADPFTERVQKGDKALYRARFAGFDKEKAEAACRQLKRSDFQCMTLKD